MPGDVVSLLEYKKSHMVVTVSPGQTIRSKWSFNATAQMWDVEISYKGTKTLWHIEADIDDLEDVIEKLMWMTQDAEDMPPEVPGDLLTPEVTQWRR